MIILFSIGEGEKIAAARKLLNKEEMCVSV